MAYKMNELAAGLAGTELGNKLKNKSAELDRLASSPEGKAAQQFADKNSENIRKAAESGDEKALKDLLSGFLNSPEGSKLANELFGIIK